jgi:hypothetical protein
MDGRLTKPGSIRESPGHSKIVLRIEESLGKMKRKCSLYFCDHRWQDYGLRCIILEEILPLGCIIIMGEIHRGLWETGMRAFLRLDRHFLMISEFAVYILNEDDNLRAFPWCRDKITFKLWYISAILRGFSNSFLSVVRWPINSENHLQGHFARGKLGTEAWIAESRFLVMSKSDLVILRRLENGCGCQLSTICLRFDVFWSIGTCFCLQSQKYPWPTRINAMRMSPESLLLDRESFERGPTKDFEIAPRVLMAKLWSSVFCFGRYYSCVLQ